MWHIAKREGKSGQSFDHCLCDLMWKESEKEFCQMWSLQNPLTHCYHSPTSGSLQFAICLLR
jgi:hypothetical protein